MREIATPRRIGNRKLHQRNSSLSLTLMALPTIVFIFIFNYIPLYGLVLPFKNFNASKGLFGSEWCGFENFKFLFGGNSIMTAMRNTLLYNVVFIFVGMAAAVCVSLLLFEVSKNYVKFFQTTFLLPYFISWVAVAYIVNAFLDADFGMLNSIISKLGGTKIMWYSEAKYWPGVLVIAALWKGFGYSTLVYYAALMGLDKELFEAATIDGATHIQQIWYISIPLIKQMIIMMLILGVGRIFNSDFGLFYNVPLNSSILYKTTDVIDTFVYRALIQTGDIGMSSAAGAFQAVVGFILVLATNFVVKKIDQDSAIF